MYRAQWSYNSPARGGPVIPWRQFCEKSGVSPFVALLLLNSHYSIINGKFTGAESRYKMGGGPARINEK